MVVNTGIIDGQVNFKAGPDARFENSGVMGVFRPGAGTRHVVSGIFAQTEAGVLALRIGRRRSQRQLKVDGAARLAGTRGADLRATKKLKNNYRIVKATDAVTGKFDDLVPFGLPSFSHRLARLQQEGESIWISRRRSPRFPA